MRLLQLDIRNFRNLESVDLEFDSHVNLISGSNGAGKSSVLEAIQCLATGHTFRTRKPRELIRGNEHALMLVARLIDERNGSEHRCGVERARDGSISIRLDFAPINQLADITRLLPVKVMTPDSLELITGSPDERRQFLDWGLFHVEPDFLLTWRQYRRALSQRNQLLREQAASKEIHSWNEILVTSAELLDHQRERYIELLSSSLAQRLKMASSSFHVDLLYRRGWAAESDLACLLVDNLDQHRRMKTTTEGPHRAELQMVYDKVPVRQRLSRGELKTLVYLLHLAQLDILAVQQAQQAVILCDDLFSELDTAHSEALIEQLLMLGSQLFLTGVDIEQKQLSQVGMHFKLYNGTLLNSV